MVAAETAASAYRVQEQLKTLIGEQLQVVTYKWLARHFSLPAALAKQLLFAFAEAHRGKADITYLLSGWTHAAKGGDDRQHVVHLVDAARLQERLADLCPVTGLHIYSVQPAQPKDTAELWNTDHEQGEQLFARMLKASSASGNSMQAGAALSGVSCEAATRDPLQRKRSKAAETSSAAAAAQPAAGPKGKLKGAAAVPATEGKQAQATKPRQSQAQQPEVSGGKAAASVEPPAANDTSNAAAKKAAYGLSGLWSKAPAQKAQAAVPVPAQAAGGAEAALRGAQEDGAGSSDEEDVAVTAPGSKRGRNTRALALEDDEDEASAPAAKSMPPASAGTVYGKQPGSADAPAASKKSSATKAAAKAPAQRRATAAAADEQENKAADNKVAAVKDKSSARAAVTPVGHVKTAEGLGPKRRKVMRTTYDERGEEVTEMVWEDQADGDSGTAQIAPAAPQPASSPMEAEPALKSPTRGEEVPSKKGSGSGRGSKASGGTKASGGSGGRGAGAGKRSGKGKLASAASQPGIKSFFGAKQ